MLGSSDKYFQEMQSINKGIKYIFFYISTLFMPIIMLNLLIAIIGDSYEKIKSAEIEVFFMHNKFFKNFYILLLIETLINSKYFEKSNNYERLLFID